MLDVGAANDVAPAFGLQIDGVQAEPVFVDDAIDAAITAAADGAARFFAAAAVAHFDHELNDKALKVRRRTCSDMLENFGGQSPLHFALDGIQAHLWRNALDVAGSIAFGRYHDCSA